MNWLNLLLVGAAADLLWVVCRPPRRVRFDTREVADAGWSSGRINRVAALVAVCGVALVGVLGVVTAGPLIGAAAAATAAVASGACTSLLTRVLPKQVIAAYRRRQMAAVTPWLELVALYMAAGQSINTAVVSAAKRTTDPGLAAIRSQMGTALTAGVDPLTGLARVTADPAVQRLVTTIRSAETAGGPATGLVVGAVERSIDELEAQRLVDIDSQGRSVNATAQQVGMVAVGVVITVAVQSVRGM